MQVTLISFGTHGGDTLTLAAREALDRAEILIGAHRLLDAVPDDGRTRFCAYDPLEIAAFLGTQTAERAAVLLSGDVGFYSGARGLLDALRGHDVRLIPGVSSVVYFAARLGIPWENLHFVSLHGKQGSIAVHVRAHERTFFLLGGNVTAGEVCARLTAFGLGAVRVSVGVRLGYPEEEILTGTAAELQNCQTDRLCVLLAENPGFCHFLPTCIPDAAFTRGSVPMTKSAVRGVSLSSLEIHQNAVCWDIGCGTGSVSVEMALRCPDGFVHALDRSAEAVRLTRENARRFACDNVIVTEGTAPDALDALPPPDAVFIGGSGGNLDAIFEQISRKNPKARIAVNAVTLETLEAARAAFAKFGGNCSITQLAVTETRALGGYTMLQAQSPVFLLSGVISCGA